MDIRLPQARLRRDNEPYEPAFPPVLAPSTPYETVDYARNTYDSLSMTKVAEHSASQVGPRVVGTGLLALDVILPAGLQRSAAWCMLGGTCGNVLAILSALGWQAFPVGRLDPDDSVFSLLTDDLALWGLRRDFLHVERTSQVPVITQRNQVSPDGGCTHSFSFRCLRCRKYLPGYQPIRIDSAEQILQDLPACEVFFFDRSSPGNLVLARQAAAHGALVVFEPTGIGKGSAERHFREALAVAHVLKYSSSRLPGFANATHFGRTPLLEIETLGETGLRYRRAGPETRTDEWVKLEAFPGARQGDSVGAGDWTSAVTIHLLQLTGQCHPTALLALPAVELEETLRAGQAAAAWNCQFQGARGGMYQQISALSEFIRSLTGREYCLQLTAHCSPPALHLLPLDDVMRKLCPVCRGCARCRRRRNYARNIPKTNS